MVSKLENDDLEKLESAMDDPTPQWYILKCQVNREDRCRKELEMRVRVSGLTEYVKEVLVPVEKVQERDPKTHKLREKKQKLFPGYILVKMILNKETWFLMRETPGIGDFTGTGGVPQPMREEDVERILAAKEEAASDEVKPKKQIDFEIGDYVKVIEGDLKDVEGEVTAIDVITGMVTVNYKLFSVSTAVELEYWQIEKKIAVES